VYKEMQEFKVKPSVIAEQVAVNSTVPPPTTSAAGAAKS